MVTFNNFRFLLKRLYKQELDITMKLADKSICFVKSKSFQNERNKHFSAHFSYFNKNLVVRYSNVDNSWKICEDCEDGVVYVETHSRKDFIDRFRVFMNISRVKYLIMWG